MHPPIPRTQRGTFRAAILALLRDKGPTPIQDIAQGVGSPRVDAIQATCNAMAHDGRLRWCGPGRYALAEEVSSMLVHPLATQLTARLAHLARRLEQSGLQCAQGTASPHLIEATLRHAIEELRQVRGLLTGTDTAHPQPQPTLVCQCGTVVLKEIVYPGSPLPPCRVTQACRVCTQTGGVGIPTEKEP